MNWIRRSGGLVLYCRKKFIRQNEYFYIIWTSYISNFPFFQWHTNWSKALFFKQFILIFILAIVNLCRLDSKTIGFWSWWYLMSIHTINVSKIWRKNQNQNKMNKKKKNKKKKIKLDMRPLPRARVKLGGRTRWKKPFDPVISNQNLSQEVLKRGQPDAYEWVTLINYVT